MPRRGRRSEAAKIRWRRMDSEPDIAKPTTPQPTPQAWSPTQSPEKKKPLLMAFGPPDQTCPMVCQEEPREPSTPLRSRQGTGYRHRVMQWGYSRVSRRRRKFVLLAEAPEKKFALLVGDSHLRAIVDGFVTMPKSTFSLGVLSSPGASADELRREVLDTVLPRTPDVICLLAPSNNLSSSTTYQEAGRDFDSLLHTISNLCANVVVLDFPPRLIVEEREQTLLRQEYSRVAAKRNVRYLPVIEHFPLSHLDLWSRDGVHLSDAPGMEVLAKLLWAAVSTQLQLSAPVSESLALSAFPPLSACPPVSLPPCPPVSLPPCPPVSLPPCPPVSLPACPPVSLPACPPVSLPACPPVSLPACPPVSLPACPPISLPACPPVSLPACPPVSLPACPPVSLPACPPVSLPACPP
ncbi:leucine-rich repeat extensin-like protein 5, partial [Fundulus heteroclitus]|uniref:leucine-rich repeat extensin-like protein 5 n=1 Tax=Fundulus heteroclitus TaxID=8078 RepID=UPI00165C18A8